MHVEQSGVHPLHANNFDRLFARRGRQCSIPRLIQQGAKRLAATRLVVGYENRVGVYTHGRRHTKSTGRTETEPTEANGTTAGRRHLHRGSARRLQTVYRTLETMKHI